MFYAFYLHIYNFLFTSTLHFFLKRIDFQYFKLKFKSANKNRQKDIINIFSANISYGQNFQYFLFISHQTK